MKKIFRIVLLTILILVGISMIASVKAASVSIKASKSTANVGDKVTITVTVNATAWNLKLTGSGVSENIKGYNQDALQNKTTTKAVTLDTSKVGSKTITLTGDITDESGETTEGINKTVTVVINEKSTSTNNDNSNSNNNNNNQNNNNNNSSTPKKSSDTSLKSITVGGKNYKVGSSITVSSDTTSINIKATANSSKAKVTGTGTKELETGTNNFNIKVTAEDGTKKTYKVTVIREEHVEDTPNIEEPTNEVTVQELRLTSLAVQGVELIPTFSSEVFEYSVYIVNDTELKIDAVSNIEGANIEITGNTDLVEGENIATIKLTKDDKTAEYKIKINKTIAEEASTENKNDEEKKVGFIGSIKNWWNGSGSTITTFTIILILLGAALIFAVISYKYSNGVKGLSRHGKANYSNNDEHDDIE